MVYVFLVAWLWWADPLTNQISYNNRARQEAELAYRAGQFDRALSLYAYLSKTTTTIDPAVRLNLGHTYFQLKQYTKARPQYETLLRSDRSDLRTVAATQLGVMACFDRDSATALALFRQALLENANNEPARYNFELIKKRYSGKPMPKPGQKQRLAARKETINKPQPTGGQVERSSRQDELLRRFRQLNLSEEQALQLLNAMQQDDLPYALTQSARGSKTKSNTSGNRW
ncbi:tetratricopeptide repeat protein [Spirosoma rigui]|uniref:tetratricopeptide repeat protein n=1 Tax=Spirosoma rigui TaxID=564064 RepID=UPI0009B0CFF4|nr:tetratricopeptide repeat protein [Spirosoma rigui]